MLRSFPDFQEEDESALSQSSEAIQQLQHRQLQQQQRKGKHQPRDEPSSRCQCYFKKLSLTVGLCLSQADFPIELLIIANGASLPRLLIVLH